MSRGALGLFLQEELTCSSSFRDATWDMKRFILVAGLYPPSQKTSLPVDECASASPIGVEGMGYAPR
jgi:hypothetical protein